MANERETSIRSGIETLLALATDEAREAGGLGVTRISERPGREKSQVSRALKVLAEYGLAERNRDALTYRLGWRILSEEVRTGFRKLRQVPRFERLHLPFKRLHTPAPDGATEWLNSEPLGPAELRQIEAR